MSVQALLEQLRSCGSESIAAILRKHGAAEPVWGVKIEDMKKLLKPHKGDVVLACALFESGVYDAQYFAGLMADGRLMSQAQLQHWVESANAPAIREYSVAWVTAESPFAMEMALRWIADEEAGVAATGWAVLTQFVSVTPDAQLDVVLLGQLLTRVEATVHQQENRVRAAMNNFVIALGCFVVPMHAAALAAGKTIGKVAVDVGDTACKIPFAPEYIEKVVQRGSVGKKRKSVKC